MKLTDKYLKQLIIEIIKEESEAAKQAHKLNLKSKGWGNWADASGKIVAKTQDGKLVKASGSSVQKSLDKAKEKQKSGEPLTKKEFSDKTGLMPDFAVETELDGICADLSDSDMEMANFVDQNRKKISDKISKGVLQLYNTDEKFKKQMNASDPRDKFKKLVSGWVKKEVDKLKDKKEKEKTSSTKETTDKNLSSFSTKSEEAKEALKDNEKDDEYYQVVYYDETGGHGNTDVFTGKGAFKKALQSANKLANDKEFKDNTPYIGVEGNGDKFGIARIDKNYYDNMNVDMDFKDKEAGNKWMEMAKKTLNGEGGQVALYSKKSDGEAEPETVASHSDKPKSKEDWIAGTLLNDENASDDEMKDYFIKNGLSEKEANHYIGQRNDALQKGVDFKLKPFSEQKNFNADYEKIISTIKNQAPLFAKKMDKGVDEKKIDGYFENQLKDKNGPQTEKILKGWSKVLGIDAKPFTKGKIIEDGEWVKAIKEKIKQIYK